MHYNIGNSNMFCVNITRSIDCGTYVNKARMELILKVNYVSMKTSTHHTSLKTRDNPSPYMV